MLPPEKENPHRDLGSNKTDSKQVSWITNIRALEQILSESREMQRRTELGQNVPLT